MVRDELQYTAGLIETCKAELLEDFAAWFKVTYGEDLADSERAGVRHQRISSDMIMISDWPDEHHQDCNDHLTHWQQWYAQQLLQKEFLFSFQLLV